MYHGEGSMVHSSGVTYVGMWMNGRPASECPITRGVTHVTYLRVVEPVAIKYNDQRGGNNNDIIVEQGKTFDVHLICVDARGATVTLGEPLQLFEW